MICILLSTIAAQGQIRIGGNVYGGGNKGQVEGSANVRVCAGELNKVFGGARMANVGGRTFVNIDGKHASDTVIISEVYGGNDVAGTIGQSGETTAVPTELENVLGDGETKETQPKKNAIDNTWKTFVKTSRSAKLVSTDSLENKWILIGSLFGGGNGDFTYVNENGDSLRDEAGNYIVQEVKTVDGITTRTTIATSPTPFTHPDIDKTYLEIKGGEIAHVYGGGNNATVRENTTINIDNKSDVCQGFVTAYATATEKTPLQVIEYLKTMSGLRTFQSDITSFNFNHARVFGGNNKAPMAIRPTWNLQQGVIRDLYSGGNQGDMYSPEGLLVEIDPAAKNVSSPYVYDATKNDSVLSIHNVYGGCRMADVKPLVNGVYTPCPNLTGYNFPPELSARVLVRGGNIDNVYGGNDITGTVYGGNAIGIYSTINGDVYGGGNGAYAYSDQLESKGDPDKGDFYYSADDYASTDALKAHRPNAEQVSIRLKGKDSKNQTIIKGSVYVGGNCASLATKKSNPLVELKIGSHVIADKVFLGNNGEQMVDSTILSLYNNREYSSIDLTNSSNMAEYMLGAAMDLQPSVVFDNEANGDPATYDPYTSYIGSFYCGGNRGSMIIPGKNTYEINKGLYIFDKFVGGCNNADVEEVWTGKNHTGTQLCASYEGGILGSASEQEDYTEGGKIKDRLEINLKNLTILPLRWRDESKTAILWNTNKWDDDKNDFVPCDRNPSNDSIRLLGGNVYGGCYESGHVNGNVTININDDVLKRSEVFSDPEFGGGERTSGVKLLNQRDDVMAVAMTIFGAGCGEDTEIWGSTKVNLNKGYAFQIFGGGEDGVVGRKRDVKDGQGVVVDQEYYFDPAYSTTVNLNSISPVYSSTDMVEDLAETEYIYGGGNEGDVCGNTYVNLGNGRIYDAFGGASDADILGHTEVYIGRQPKSDGTFKNGFPWIKDIVYGGNDFGGTIHGEYEDGYDFTSRIRNFATDGALLHGTPTNSKPGVLKSASYVEYLQGRVDTIFGGGYGYYDYTSDMYEGASMPYMQSSFVNIRPKNHASNYLNIAFGGGTGYPKNREGDKSQDRSYVLVDIPDGVTNFKKTQIFGSGAYNGMGMRFDKAASFADSFDQDQLSSIVDLVHGNIKSVFGGSYNEGVTARTVINVPEKSTIHIDSIFGGAYGTQILPPCDVYESNVNYRSSDATVTGAIYGGNNNERRTLYAKVNIHAPVWSNKEKGYNATVYGAGHGIDTWTEYTEVNLMDSAKVYEVYGGGEMGHVLNAESVQQYMQLYHNKPSAQISAQDPVWSQADHWTGAVGTSDVASAYTEQWAKDWKDAWTLGDYYVPNADYTNYATNAWTNLTNAALVTHDADMDDRDFSAYSNEEKAKRQYKYNTNVRIHEGATVVGYAYGGGLGDKNLALSGDVYGTTYIGLLGGRVNKDIYAAGTTGAVYDLFGVGSYNASTNTTGFTASANAYIKGGSCRNVYGGGWKGNVGAHIDPETHSSTDDITVDPSDDIPGETHVVIGDVDGSSFTSGIPTVQRNAYGGGEGGAVYGKAHLRMNNGYVGYTYNSSSKKYEEKIEDDTRTTPNTFLQNAGCLFGGGYIDNSIVDKTQVNIYGGYVRGSVFGGGEIAAIGRGVMNQSTVNGKTTYSLDSIYRPGKTNVEMYGGEVHRNVFGGGRGSDNLGNHGTLFCDGYIFGQTEVRIHGGEIGTVTGVADGNGNVFGGGDEGVVYSAYEKADSTFGIGKKEGERYDGLYQGYYYKYENDAFVTEDIGGGKTERQFTEDCKVLVEPHLKVNTAVIINGHSYKAGEYVSIGDLNTMGNKSSDYRWEYLDPTGIIIHNAVFAGGNTPAGSLTTSANTATVFGNATASVNDIYHRDMITLGTRHTGGLYGDGNLTLVDGYRELNITNYGTDYYSIAKQIGIDAYHALPKREADYYELRYKCIQSCKDKDSTLYKPATTDDKGFTTKASTITADEMQSLFVEEKDGKKVSVKDHGTDILVYDEEKGEWVPNPNGGSPYWEENGVLPVYAGRLMNSIQRADLCGVWGSRMVMQGAQDRVPDEVDYTNYTINRVREVSLNKKATVISADSLTADSIHGNYFGIYNIVNYLGALTSDVDFGDETTRPYARTTENTTDDAKYKCAANGQAYETASFYDWKNEFKNDRRRNNGSSHNKVALASGVYLELTSEESTGSGLYEKVWGPITGVIELDLINVSTGIGGGFVYAKNEHGVRSKSGHKNTTLTALNKGAVTHWDFDYATADANRKVFETSGNFVHSTQTIIDDCYNISNKYLTADGVPAHYWYIKGSTYVYDQYISAYTGVSNAFSETVDIPLTIAAASHGTMKLLNVQPNLYAYYSSPGVKLGDGKKVVINNKTYYRNDPISYWDWYLLSNSEKELFVDSTFVNCMKCKIDGVTYEAGAYVMNKNEFATYKNSSHTYTDTINAPILKPDKTNADDAYIFRLSNNVSHNTGYLLTYEVNNPSKWDNWYTPKSDETTGGKIALADYDALSAANKEKYYDGPTYRLKVDEGGEVLGQSKYSVGDLISKAVYDTYQDAKKRLNNNALLSDSAHFDKAYIITTETTITEGSAERHLNPGATISQTMKTAHSITACDTAYICTKSIQVSKEEIIYKDSRMTRTEKNTYVSGIKSDMDKLYSGASTKTTEQIKALSTDESFTAEKKKQLLQLAGVRDELNTYLVQAYYCEEEGLYGGNYYESGMNYRGLEAWSSMSETDREKFKFNYDALDLLIDPNYTTNKTGYYSEGQKYQYDGNYTSADQVNDVTTGNKAGYSVTQSVDYTATYNGNETTDKSETVDEVTKKYMEVSTSIISSGKVYVGDELSRDDYESLPNEQRHYSPVAVKDAGTYYVVNTAFQIGSTPYAVGEVISGESYSSLPTDEQEYITQLTFDEDHKNATYYYCRESYEQGGTVTPISSSAVTGAGGGISEGNVLPGTLISKSEYDLLPNQQKNFTIHGISPTETSTLFVSRESNIYDLSKEKIITVIYQYDYDETDGNGNVTPISERHVVNIHLTFKSGVPTVADITKPEIILPGDFTLLREPTVTPGAYEVTGGGWELFETERDAESHSNGIDFIPNFDPLYWYQDGYYVAYYAKSYLGRTYSNAVPVSVANYHDLADVMSDENKAHHMYIDNKNVKREPKIYINDYSGSGKNGLDLFKNLYDLSLVTTSSSAETDGYTIENDSIKATTGSANTALKGHHLLSTQTRAERNLEFFLRTDINHTGTWTSIGADGVSDDPETKDVDEGVAGKCFDGVFHGDGHTISGLDHSLFNYLCGEVYNLGVTGSFTGAGIAENGGGYVESCWVNTTGTPDGSVRAVFGNPSAASDIKQIVNSYCQTDKTYNTTDTDSHGLATPMSGQQFYNGTVAYDLNNFYLYKRYNDGANGAHNPDKAYKYWVAGESDPQTAYYASNPAFCSSGYNSIKYVEDRFADGDFRYASGSIPDSEDERTRTEKMMKNGKEVDTTYYAPLWPDDYIFFGQKLTYGYGTETHQDVPTAVVRDGGHISLADNANRVYRAPAYYGSKTMGVAHFNPQAYLAQRKSTQKNGKAAPEYADTLAYPGMTAIDFAGHNGANEANGTYGLGTVDGKFYAPLLDDDGLTDIENCDETKNLLVYAPATTGEGYTNEATHTVLTSYFTDPIYNNYYDNHDEYRLVDVCQESVNGHLVQSSLNATNDHLLVDKEDFNAPIAYSFDDDHLMWYQRKPADNEFVDNTKKGWTGISIPFTAELVTTNDKGEITHFYSGSEESKNGTGSKIGHEYWLREFNEIKTVEGVAKANFIYPTATGNDKTISNTFLWDYYYEKSERKDKNSDLYQQYYKNSRTFKSYPLLTGAKPYIIGFPGKTYYEFDLSGNFTAQNTYASIDKLLKQTITFASETGISIGVSDDEMAGVTKNGYTFRPTYMKKTIPGNTNAYTMSADGDSYAKVPAKADTTIVVEAFRPYFTAEGVSLSRYIIFDSIDDGFGDEKESDKNGDGALRIYTRPRHIIVTSTLKEPRLVTITNAAGVRITTFTIEPGQTIETLINMPGFYIVNKTKVAVR